MDRSTRGIDYQHTPRPVAALADEYPPHFVDPKHRHERAQFVYASAGVMLVITDDASFVVPPQRAVWVPGGRDHEVHTRNHVSIRTLYVDETARPGLPQTCRVIEVSPLLRELVIEAARLPIEYDVAGRDGRVMDLILDEITASDVVPFEAPMPRDRRLLRMCRTILDDPSNALSLDEWARETGMGRRTFTRVFRRETGMTFATWRQNARLMEALSRLSMGESVTTVALDVGYSSPSAFTALFRRTFGVTPTSFLARAHKEEARV